MSQQINCWVFFVSLRYLEIFFCFQKKLCMLYEHRSYGNLPFEKGNVHWECEKCLQSHYAVRTTAAASFFFCLPWGTVWEQRCSCKHFAPQFVTWPCLWVKNTLLCRSPEITRNSSKVKGKIVQIQCKQHSSRRKGRGTMCKLPHPRFSQKGLSPPSSQPTVAFRGVHTPH